MNVLERYQIGGEGATEIAASIEGAVLAGRIPPGAQLPPVRTLAAALGVSPATVAASYAALRQRGMLVTGGRRGTHVRSRPALPVRSVRAVPEGVRNLAHGNPDPSLLPALERYLDAGDHPLYGEDANVTDLVDIARERFRSDGIPADEVAVVGGALDGVERCLQVHLSPGDVVAVEDPGYPNVFDLCSALGYTIRPFAVDEEGPVPRSFESALKAGAKAAIVTPRAQNPSGGAITAERAEDLRLVLRRHPETFVVEDDHAGPIAGARHRTLAERGRPRWAVVRSVSKSLGPDLRVALVAGDTATIGRVEGRRLLGTGWVSHILQRTVLNMWRSAELDDLLERATDAYALRRRTLIAALGQRGIEASGRSGLNVWVAVPEEAPAVAALLDAGWAVAPGEPYRLTTGPAIRITVSTLDPDQADDLASAVDSAMRPSTRTHSA